MKAPDERYGSDDDGKIDQQIQDVRENVDHLHVDAVPFDALIPRKVDWRAEEQAGEEDGNLARDAEDGEHVQRVPEPSFLQREDAFVEKQDRQLSEHHRELVCQADDDKALPAISIRLILRWAVLVTFKSPLNCSGVSLIRCVPRPFRISTGVSGLSHMKSTKEINSLPV